MLEVLWDLIDQKYKWYYIYIYLSISIRKLLWYSRFLYVFVFKSTLVFLPFGIVIHSMQWIGKKLQYIRNMGFWRMVLRFQTFAKVGKSISVLVVLQWNSKRPFWDCECEVKEIIGSWRYQGSPPRNTVHMKRHKSKGEAHLPHVE